jgi:hypothetical protein
MVQARVPARVESRTSHCRYPAWGRVKQQVLERPGCDDVAQAERAWRRRCSIDGLNDREADAQRQRTRSASIRDPDDAIAGPRSPR